MLGGRAEAMVSSRAKSSGKVYFSSRVVSSLTVAYDKVRRSSGKDKNISSPRYWFESGTWEAEKSVESSNVLLQNHLARQHR